MLCAALMHASWAAAMKKTPDPLLGALGVAAGTVAATALAIGFLPAPLPAAWPWMAGSIVIHLVYFTAMSLAYRGGHLAPLYALMRGTPPLLVALVSLAVGTDKLTPTGWAGLLLLCGGLLSLIQGKPASRGTLAWALLSAACTATYTLVDGTGSRLAGTAAGYVAWHGLFQSLLFGAGVLALRKREAVDFLRHNLWQSLWTGSLSIAAYALALWAMGRAPIALVAALRETSVLFAAILGAVWLREPLGWRRGAAAALVAAGAAVMHLG